MFTAGAIEGVATRPLTRSLDERGWVLDFWRHDELPSEFRPVQTQGLLTLPGVRRGPFSHAEQAEVCCFPGPGDFKLTLWDARPDSPTRDHRVELFVGASAPLVVLIPSGVVYSFRCISAEAGWMLMGANRLFRGKGRKQAPDLVCHDTDPQDPFLRDEETRRLRG